MLTRRLQKLPVQMATFIRQAGALADELGVNVYVVGGFVRDLFLDVDNFDVDLVVEGDGIAFARECARRFSLRLVTHGRFGTATLHGLDGFKTDIASSRKEVYEEPAALPVVSKGDIRDDLLRRDFTINAMAIGISRHFFGAVFDFYSARKDLKAKTVRALHVLSFRDDPTRILRAVRFEQRLKFRIEPRTLIWIRQAVRDRMLHRIQKHRLRDELLLVFGEKDPLPALKRLSVLCGYDFLSPELSYSSSWKKSFMKVRQQASWFARNFPHKRALDLSVMYMSLFFGALSRKALERLMTSYAFHKSERVRIMSFCLRAGALLKVLNKRHLKPSQIWRCCEPLSYEVIVLLLVMGGSARVRRRIENFLRAANGLRLAVRGEDLFDLGIKPGPHFKKILTALLYAKIDGKIADKSQELALAKVLMKRQCVYSTSQRSY